MEPTRMGNEALTGWRTKVGDPIAQQVSARTSLSEDQVKAAIGAFFFLSSLWYVIQTVKAAAKHR